jgi:hypothetical protein
MLFGCRVIKAKYYVNQKLYPRLAKADKVKERALGGVMSLYVILRVFKHVSLDHTRSTWIN